MAAIKTEFCCAAGVELYFGPEETCDEHPHIRRVKAEFCGVELLGAGIFGFDCGRDKDVIRDYIRTQEKDRRLEQMRITQYPATNEVARQNGGRLERLTT